MGAGVASQRDFRLLAGDGVGTVEIAERVGVSKPTVVAWKKHYRTEGLGGLEDRPKPGRRPEIDEVAIVLRIPAAAAAAPWGDALVVPAAGGGDGPNERLGRCM